MKNDSIYFTIYDCSSCECDPFSKAANPLPPSSWMNRFLTESKSEIRDPHAHGFLNAGVGNYQLQRKDGNHTNYISYLKNVVKGILAMTQILILLAAYRGWNVRI